MIIGVDLGKKTTGLAISSGTIASPLQTVTHNNIDQAIEKISKIAREEQADKIVLGFVEGKIKKYFQEFARRLQLKNPQIEVVLVDETLTSRQATETMININLPKNKRRQKEHEFAACHILESYLNELND